VVDIGNKQNHDYHHLSIEIGLLSDWFETQNGRNGYHYFRYFIAVLVRESQACKFRAWRVTFPFQMRYC